MKNFTRYIPAVIVMVVINFVSGTPGPVIQDAGLGNEKLHIIGHFFMFFTLYLSYYFATKKILLSFVLSFAYGIFDEYHQKFIYLRSPSIFDIKINTLGAISGMLLVKFVEKFNIWKK